jgi:hypothetical protein
MTHKANLVELCKALGLKEVNNLPMRKEYWVQDGSVTLGAGRNGHDGGFVKFHFDMNGEVMSHNMWRGMGK